MKPLAAILLFITLALPQQQQFNPETWRLAWRDMNDRLVQEVNVATQLFMAEIQRLQRENDSLRALIPKKESKGK
jgi:hypothetical protein